jgi:acyl-CoA reductase-like NAD-dependent aldehyde dehydrogenase
MFCAFCKLGPAVALGNTFVLKPSPFTPLTALKVASLWKDVYPPGVVNIVTGSDKLEFNVGAHLSSHPDVKKVSFTGSVPTGKKIYQGAAKDVKRITLEMGGNDAAIIRSDFDVEKLGPKLFGSSMANTGQVCCAVKRIYAHEDVYEKVVDKLVECAKSAKVGDGFEEGVEYGPLNNAMQFEKVKGFVKDAEENGAKIACGGAPLDRPGYFYPPTVITNVKEGNRIVDEEQFGPVIPVMSYSTDDEAIERANNSEYGLGGSVWGKDVKKANELGFRLEAGTVWVNDHLSPTGGPFGGFKQSGIGRELSLADVNTYTECQTIRLAK